jgi:hypothetical protein
MLESEVRLKMPFDLIQTGLAPYALAVGALCNSWSKLESYTRTLFLLVSGMPPDRHSYAIVHCLPFNDQLTAIKVAFVGRARDPRLTETAIAAINYIDNILGPRRNRYVHDLWQYDDYEQVAERFDRTVRIARPQSRKPLEVTALKITQEKLDDIWTTVREVKEHADVLYDLQKCFLGHDGALEALLKSPPQRRFLQAQPGKPDPSGNIPSTP